MKEYNEQVVETLDDAGCIIANKNIIIDNLQARIAELEAENARLKAECDDIKQVQFPRKLEAVAVGWKKQLAAAQEENAHWQKATAENENKCIDACDQLAAEQLNNKRLRDALQAYIDEHEECQDADDWMAMMCSVEAHHAADEAISQPSDTSALDTFVAEKVKEYGDEARRQMQHATKAVWQRDLAVEALKSCGVNDGLNGPTQYFDEDLVERAIKESEGM